MAKQSILVIDDEPAIRDMLQIALDAAGFKVGLAEDAKQAYPIIIDTPPDLILLDWMMPGTSGIELLRRLRRDEINVPVIMLTAKVEEASKISGLDSGADDYIAKPFSPRELVSRVSNSAKNFRGQYEGSNFCRRFKIEPTKSSSKHRRYLDFFGTYRIQTSSVFLNSPRSCLHERSNS